MSRKKQALDASKESEGLEPGQVAQVSAGLSDLPDELLIAVLSYVDKVADLLKLRAVCRRWRDLALHPDVWRHRYLMNDDDDGTLNDRILEAVLCLAPCLRKLDLYCADSFLPSRAALAATAKCAVQRLDILADWCGGVRGVVDVVKEDAAVGVAALVVRNQAALGRLRTARFSTRVVPVSSNHRLLLRALCEAEGLTKLKVYSSPGDPTRAEREALAAVADLPGSPVPDRAVPATLRELVWSAWLPDANLEYVLRCHAATLGDVNFSDLRAGSGCRVPVASLLSESPTLRSLRCPLLAAMFLLKKCPALRVLHLHLASRGGSREAGLLRDARTFLREATQLEEVHLHSTEDEAAKDVPGALICALAASRCSEVKIIEVWISKKSLGPVPAGLGGALRTLPNLWRLDVTAFDSPATDFLDAVTPVSAPRLRWLRVRGPPAGQCGHAWLHGVPVTQLLRRNRLLHLEFSGVRNVCSTKSTTADQQPPVCSPCRRKCHYSREPQDMWKGALALKVVAFAHPKEETTCGEEHRDDNVAWWEYWCELA